MAERTIEYIDSRYKVVSLLSENERARVEIVQIAPGNALAVKKTVNSTSSIYPLLRQIRHAGLVDVLDVIPCNGQTVIIEEYASGKSLQHFISEQGTFDWRTAANVVIQLCDALTAVHDFGIIHGNIKPSNIIVSEGGGIKLIDFDGSQTGLTRSRADGAYSSVLGYSAPERYGHKEADIRSDIYSVGILFNQMLTGKASRENTLDGKSGNIITKCTMLNPEDRFQNAQELKDALLAEDNTPRKEMKRLDASQAWKISVILLALAASLINTFANGAIGIADPIFTVITHFFILVPPLAFILDFLRIRSIPIIPIFRKKLDKKGYIAAYFALWILAAVLLQAIAANL